MIYKKLYPNLKVDWKLLELACLYHDLGKMNLKFQRKIVEGKKDNTEIAHNLLSLAFVNAKKLKEQYNFSNVEIKFLAHAIAYHHDRGVYEFESYKKEVEELKKEIANFKYEKVQIEQVKMIATKYFDKGRVYEEEKGFYNYVLLKGLLNRLDYAASGHIDVESENNFLEDSMDNLLLNWKKEDSNKDWNKLQNFMIENREENVIAIAQTGMGKTEAGLLWIGNNKGFFTLPLKTAINEIYKRITEGIVSDRENIGLLHSDTYSKYLEKESEIDNVQDYYNKTKQLSLPLTVCTLDQLFDFVYRYRDFEPKLATLAYSKVVIDEIQMYSPELLAYLILGLEHITKVGGKFAILTATFPPFIEDILEKKGIKPKKADNPFIDNTIRHSVKILESQINIDMVIDKFSNNKILIVCNTVKKAQEIYDELIKHKIDKNILNLIHSKFIKKDRAQKETDIMKLGDKESKDYGIWIGTQVVEASLDIDFDLLFTELSDINGLLQRLGRCHRKRKYEGKDYNCYVYIGDQYPCSGIRNSDKSIIDIDIFQHSKDALLKENIEGALSEKRKLELIDQIYTTEQIKNTQYYKKLEDTMKYLKTIVTHELSKSEVKKRFRNIFNVSVIPMPVYEENQERIEELITEINRELKEGENYQERKIQRYRLMDELRGYTVSISYSEANSFISPNNCIMLGKYEQIFILDCEYSFERGIVFLNSKAEGNKKSEFDSIFV